MDLCLRHGSLFAGVGGFDLAAAWMGWHNVFHCEINPFCQKVLKYHFPESICYEDIKEADFRKHKGEIDILTGGFPCQPFSVAGKRKGTDDDRYLWPEMLRAVCDIRPEWVVAENVRGLLNWNGGMVFEEVCSNLETEGYEVLPFLLPAAGVGAPHRRERIWIIGRDKKSIGKDLQEGSSSHTNSFGCNNGGDNRQGRPHNGHGRASEEDKQERKRRESRSGTACPFTSNADTFDVQNGWPKRGRFEEENPGRTSGRPQHAYVQDYWKDFPSVSPVCRPDDGVFSRLDGISFSKFRTESIKGFGNAIVPQIAYQIFKSIEACLRYGYNA
ncbi:DNA cytosine methyltransferase [Sphingobacterium phlebotomi]|uniref:Cytosine-specific methyltransferase n=1 Tax=Sphingobacterium phlebotomi TaxID=2605433 RepID=A0A5D4HA10_9SPHI|nr:DNA cytosine methyltransferase [Sphingobacterium phlebotomi]TYR37467.1 DNA cytosine methyltransferase [Sphingobacterium phlebotomi]